MSCQKNRLQPLTITCGSNNGYSCINSLQSSFPKTEHVPSHYLNFYCNINNIFHHKKYVKREFMIIFSLQGTYILLFPEGSGSPLVLLSSDALFYSMLCCLLCVVQPFNLHLGPTTFHQPTTTEMEDAKIDNLKCCLLLCCWRRKRKNRLK